MIENLYQRKYRIDSARLAGYDYGSNGMYFITICTRNREWCFGDIVPDGSTPDGVAMHPSVIGQVAMDCWLAIPTFHPYVHLDAFQLMPNHMHGIIWICKPIQDQPEWQTNQFGPQRQNLPSIIRGYKSGVTKYATQNQLGFAWQPRYYDRIVRNQYELDRIRLYIENNPAKWDEEQQSPQNLYM